ncbi:MAG TPA: glycosyltransferase [Bacillota bacterium]|nr:glycosyltransferase [Bacillota bacterium]
MKEICLLNDSFPPILDGVSNAVVNYAKNINGKGIAVSVVTPDHPEADDAEFPFPVLRYPSLDLRKLLGYPAGLPFFNETLDELRSHDIALLHSHCPFSSQIMARRLRETLDVPLVMTYHTKFDIDIANAIHSRFFQEGAIKALADNVNSCDEVWTVSRGAGENLRSIGYKGDYIVMENGVDIPKGRMKEDEFMRLTAYADIARNLPVFLFVGRLKWYKGIRIILDALAALRSQDFDFRMIFVGKGGDAEEMKAYSEKAGLTDCCVFLGPVYDRELLTAWYCRADLFLFPSTFDTNGLVVREAAACSLPCVLVRDSCAAEGVSGNVNGFLIDENAASLAVCLARIMNDKPLLQRVGRAASEELYVSWSDAVGKAISRYEKVVENYKAGKYQKRPSISDEFFRLSGELDDSLFAVKERSRELKARVDRYL